MHDWSSVKEEVRQSIDLVDLVAEHVSLVKSGNGFRGLCPFHKEKTPSFHVLPAKGIFHCFGCKAGGDVFKFIQLREGIGFAEALQMLAARAGITLTRRTQSETPGRGRSDIAQANAWAQELFKKQLHDPETGLFARQYVAERGISEEMCERFGLGLALNDNAGLLKAARLAGLSEELLHEAGLIKSNEQGQPYDAFRHRLMFPIRDTTKRLIGFGGRTLGDARAKYLNTAQNKLFDKGRVLYGLDLARAEMVSKQRAIIVEGYTDCIACHQAGFAETVASLGTAMTESHIESLRRHCGTIVLLFDSDNAGEAAAERALRVALRHGMAVRLAFVPSGKDPSDFLAESGPDAFESLLNSAVDALTFTWNRTQVRYRSEDETASRRDAVRGFVTMVAELSQYGSIDAIQQGLIVNQIAKLLSLPGRQVHDLILRSTQPGQPSREMSSQVRSAAGLAAAKGTTEQVAMIDILKVLLNESALYEQVRDFFDPERIADPTCRRIAEAVRDLAERVGEFTLLEVLDCFADPGTAQQVTELHLHGDRRGNYEATLEGAVACLRRVAELKRAAELTRQLHQEANKDADNNTAKDKSLSVPLETLQEVGQAYRHFAPRSKRDAEARTWV